MKRFGWILLALLVALCLSVGLTLSYGSEDTTPKPTTAPSNDTWTDPQSGLMWQVNPKNPTGGALDWFDARKHCKNLTLAGHDDWRLPTISEFRSLIRGCPATETGGSCKVTDSCRMTSCRNEACDGCSPRDGPARPLVPQPIGQHTNGCYQPSELQGGNAYYWSSSPIVDAVTFTWTVFASTGGVYHRLSFISGGTRCVRLSQSTSGGREDLTQTPRPTPSSVTWKDSRSGLTWQVNPSGKMTWSKAKSHCKNLILGGYSDWRLPTISELRSLIRGCLATQTGGSCGVTDSCHSYENCSNTACHGCSAGNGPANGCHWASELQGDCWYYWSSSPVADIKKSAWFVEFDLGNIFYSFVLGSLYVRCVR